MPRKRKTKWQKYWEKQPKKKVFSVAQIPMEESSLLPMEIEIPLLDTTRGCRVIFQKFQT